MAFARNKDFVRINGRTVVKIDATGAGYADIGFVAEVTAKSTPMQEETTEGDLPVGYDLSLEFAMKQTSAADYTAILDVAYPTAVKAFGSNDHATLTTPTVVPTLDKKFDGKTGSKIGVVAMYKGATKAQAAAFLSNAS